MKKFISLKLVFIFIISSLAPAGHVMAAKKIVATEETASCKNGECINDLIERLQNLSEVYTQQCLPKNIPARDISKFHEENGLTEECWKYITEINHLDSELQKHKTRLESRLGCEQPNCSSKEEDIASKISQLKKVEQGLSCNEIKKQEISNNCKSDLSCVLASSAMSIGTLGLGNYAAEAFLPSGMTMKNCHMGDDSCMTRLALGFLRAVRTFTEVVWDALKYVGGKVGEQISEFWKSVTAAEEHSSTAQLAMAQVSEDPGIFEMLKNDFPGTMTKVWEAFVAALKEWFKSNIFCQTWSGRPHLSECLRPAEDFDCLPCKNMVMGLCSISGALLAEIVPEFLSGGLLAAAKFGVQSAPKLALLFKVSPSNMKALQSSGIAKKTLSGTSKINETLKIAAKLKAARAAIEASLLVINQYLLSPTRALIQSSLKTMAFLVRQGRIYVTQTTTGKILVFPAKTLKLGLNVILYPIDNPMTTFGFHAGMRTFDKVFKLGPPQLAKTTAISSAILEKDKELEPLLVELENRRMFSRTKELAKVEEQFLNRTRPYRLEILKNVLKSEDIQFSDIIQRLYPELKYGDLSKNLLPQTVSNGEKQLYEAIKAMPPGPQKAGLEHAFKQHVAQGEARSKILREPFSFEEKAKVAKKSRFHKNELQVFSLKAKPSTHKAIKFKSISQLDYQTKMYTVRALQKTRLKPNVEFRVRIQQNPENGGYIYEIYGLDKKSSQQVVKSLYDNDGFVLAINSQFKQQRTDLKIDIKTTPGGLVKMGDLNIRGKLSSLETIILPDGNTVDTVRRTIFPIIRSGNAANHHWDKEKQQKDELDSKK